uniref:Protein Wnt n=1 Tax=Ciona savignyi TaxID=51511 RepID=H2ZHF4_CIOSA
TRLLTVSPMSERYENTSDQGAKLYCDSLRYLKPHQYQRCLRQPALMAKISDGVKSGIRECQYQFRNSKWNCSIYPGPPRKHAFEPILKARGREKAFVYAILSAAVSYEITRACSNEALPTECGCAKINMHRQRFLWGGCSDDVKFGDEVSRSFLDGDLDSPKSMKKKLRQHNSEAGRSVVTNNMRRICKCHGITASCAQTVCWRSMPTLRYISDTIKQRYDGAVQAKRIRKGGLKAKNKRHNNPTPRDLVYAKPSQTDFCEENLKRGSFGTRGRVCNDSNIAATDHCALMCCDRGYRTETFMRPYGCNCVFKWCCQVKCEECRKRVTQSYCL